MNFNIKANLFGGQFSISHTIACNDFKSALIATRMMENLKENKLYGRVTLKEYSTPVKESIFSTMFESPDYGDGYVYGFTGIILDVFLPHECVSDNLYANMDEDGRMLFYDCFFENLLRFYNCFLENFMDHMTACGITPFFQYDILKDVMPVDDMAHATIMIPTFDSADGAFFDITKFSALEGVVTNAPHLDPLGGYEKTDTILKIPNGFHLENLSLHSTTGNDKMDKWYVLVPNKTEPES